MGGYSNLKKLLRWLSKKWGPCVAEGCFSKPDNLVTTKNMFRVSGGKVS